MNKHIVKHIGGKGEESKGNIVKHIGTSGTERKFARRAREGGAKSGANLNRSIGQGATDQKVRDEKGTEKKASG